MNPDYNSKLTILEHYTRINKPITLILGYVSKNNYSAKTVVERVGP